MILNVSGRTDIIAFYMKWFINRLNEGYVLVRNPFYKNLVNKIDFRNVDLIVFCTKNPLPLIPYLDKINIPYIVNITLTPYKSDIEPNVIDKKKIIEGIKIISNKIGSDKVFVRYDPIFLSDKYNISYHIKAFDKLCNNLNGYTKRITISFLNDYINVRKNMGSLKIKPFKESDYKLIGENFFKSASLNNIKVHTCCENINLVEYGFSKDDCVSPELVYKLTNKKYKKWQARKEKCNCCQMVDIGVYNTCKHLCKYCYANFSEEKIEENMLLHDDNSPLLIGYLCEDDVIKERKN